MRLGSKLVWLISLLGGVLVAATVAYAAYPPAETVPPGYTITWGGDTHLGDRAEATLLKEGFDWQLRALPPFTSDLNVVNAEAPFTLRPAPPNLDLFYDEGSPLPRYIV